MAEQGGSSSTNVLWIIAVVVGILMIPIGGVVFFAAGLGGNTGPNPSGSTLNQPISPLPDSPVQKSLQSLRRFSDTDAYLQRDAGEIDRAITALQELDAKIWPNAASGFESYSAERRQKMHGQIEQMITLLGKVRNAATTGEAQTAIADLKALEKLYANLVGADPATLVAFGTNIANQNNNGQGRARYGQVRPVQLWPDKFPRVIDCSGFMSYIIKQTANAAFPTLNVGTFYSYAKQGLNGLALVHDYNRSPLGDRDLLQLAEEGKIQPGDFILTNNAPLPGSNGRRHIVMYIGKINGSHQVVESTTSGNRQGPMIRNLGAPSSPTRAIVRYVGT